MPLRKSPTRTPAFLAAIRSNSLKSTGPRTWRGKLRSAANALENGSRSRDLRQRLLKAGDREAVACYDRIYSAICNCFRPADRREWKQAAALAGRAWAAVWTAKPPRTRRWRLALRAKGLDFVSAFPRRFRIEAPDGLRLNFWLVRRSGARWLRIGLSRPWPKRPREARPKAQQTAPPAAGLPAANSTPNEAGMYFKIGKMYVSIPHDCRLDLIRPPDKVGMFLQLNEMQMFIPPDCPALFVDPRAGGALTLDELEEVLYQNAVPEPSPGSGIERSGPEATGQAQEAGSSIGS